MTVSETGWWKQREEFFLPRNVWGAMVLHKPTVLTPLGRHVALTKQNHCLHMGKSMRNYGDTSCGGLKRWTCFGLNAEHVPGPLEAFRRLANRTRHWSTASFPVHPDAMKSSTVTDRFLGKKCEGWRSASSFGEVSQRGPTCLASLVMSQETSVFILLLWR